MKFGLISSIHSFIHSLGDIYAASNQATESLPFWVESSKDWYLVVRIVLVIANFEHLLCGMRCFKFFTDII